MKFVWEIEKTFFSGVALDGTSSKTLQDSFNNFKAAALGLPADKNVSDKIRKDDRKKSNKVDKKSDKVDKKSNKVDDSVEDDDVNLLNDRSDENVVDDLSEKVDQIKLDVSADAGAKKKLGKTFFVNSKIFKVLFVNEVEA